MKTAILAVLWASSAFAQKETEEKLSRQIDLSEIAIESTIVKPASTYILTRPKPHFGKLIKVRGSFAPELQKSTDRL